MSVLTVENCVLAWITWQQAVSNAVTQSKETFLDCYPELRKRVKVLNRFSSNNTVVCIDGTLPKMLCNVFKERDPNTVYELAQSVLLNFPSNIGSSVSAPPEYPTAHSNLPPPLLPTSSTASVSAPPIFPERSVDHDNNDLSDHEDLRKRVIIKQEYMENHLGISLRDIEDGRSGSEYEETQGAESEDNGGGHGNPTEEGSEDEENEEESDDGRDGSDDEHEVQNVKRERSGTPIPNTGNLTLSRQPTRTAKRQDALKDNSDSSSDDDSNSHSDSRPAGARTKSKKTFIYSEPPVSCSTCDDSNFLCKLEVNSKTMKKRGHACYQCRTRRRKCDFVPPRRSRIHLASATAASNRMPKRKRKRTHKGKGNDEGEMDVDTQVRPIAKEKLRIENKGRGKSEMRKGKGKGKGKQRAQNRGRQLRDGNEDDYEDNDNGRGHTGFKDASQASSTTDDIFAEITKLKARVKVLGDAEMGQYGDADVEESDCVRRIELRLKAAESHFEVCNEGAWQANSANESCAQTNVRIDKIKDDLSFLREQMDEHDRHLNKYIQMTHEIIAENKAFKTFISNIWNKNNTGGTSNNSQSKHPRSDTGVGERPEKRARMQDDANNIPQIEKRGRNENPAAGNDNKRARKDHPLAATDVDAEAGGPLPIPPITTSELIPPTTTAVPIPPITAAAPNPPTTTAVPIPHITAAAPIPPTTTAATAAAPIPPTTTAATTAMPIPPITAAAPIPPTTTAATTAVPIPPITAAPNATITNAVPIPPTTTATTGTDIVPVDVDVLADSPLAAGTGVPSVSATPAHTSTFTAKDAPVDLDALADGPFSQDAPFGAPISEPLQENPLVSDAPISEPLQENPPVSENPPPGQKESLVSEDLPAPEKIPPTASLLDVPNSSGELDMDLDSDEEGDDLDENDSEGAAKRIMALIPPTDFLFSGLPSSQVSLTDVLHSEAFSGEAGDLVPELPPVRQSVAPTRTSERIRGKTPV